MYYFFIVKKKEKFKVKYNIYCFLLFFYKKRYYQVESISHTNGNSGSTRIQLPTFF